jgi:hypothetical protein
VLRDLAITPDASNGVPIRWCPTSAPARVPPCRIPSGLVAMTISSVRQLGTDHGVSSRLIACMRAISAITAATSSTSFIAATAS